MATAKDLMKKPIRIIKNSSISETIKKLLEHNISHLVVGEGQKTVGIISEKDIGFFLFSEKSNQSLDTIPLEKIMNKVIFVDSSESIKNCAQIMIDKKIGSLCVGNEDNLEGIFTKTDITKYYAENFAGQKRIVDFMTKDFISTHSAAPISHAIKKMLDNKISRIITKNQNNEPEGIVSFRDFLKISLELGSDQGDEDFTVGGSSGFLSQEGFGGISLSRDVMTSGILQIKFHEDLSDACQNMYDNHVNALVVLDENGGVAGIISKTDVTLAVSLNG